MNSSRISESAVIAEKALESFKVMMAHHSKVTKLTDLELVEDVEYLVGLDYKSSSYERALIGELARRYEKVVQVVRPEEGFEEPTEQDLKEMEEIEKKMEADKDKVIYWVVRLENGDFVRSGLGSTSNLSEAAHYVLKKYADEEASYWGPKSTVVEITP